MAVDKSLVSGSTTMLVLKLLEEKDMYGYEMIDTIRGKSKNVFELKAGTFYPLLHGRKDPKILSYYKIRKKRIKKEVRRMERVFKSGSGCDGWCVLWIKRNIYRR